MIVVSAWHETRRSLLTIFVCPSPDCRPVYTQFSGCCGYTDLPFKAVACRFDLLFGWILAFSKHNNAPPIRTMTFVFSLSLIGGAYQFLVEHTSAAWAFLYAQKKRAPKLYSALRNDRVNYALLIIKAALSAYRRGSTSSTSRRRRACRRSFCRACRLCRTCWRIFSSSRRLRRRR